MIKEVIKKAILEYFKEYYTDYHHEVSGGYITDKSDRQCRESFKSEYSISRLSDILGSNNEFIEILDKTIEEMDFFQADV